MNTLFDYLVWRGDLTLKQSAFCAVDGLILSCLAYFPFDGVVGEKRISIAEAAERALALPVERLQVRAPEDLKLLEVLQRSPRFQQMELFAYRNQRSTEEEKQFAALTVDTGDGSLYLAFRGTDDTIVGWKEDFNMSYLETVPAQRAAAGYLMEIAERGDCLLRLGGHSKGGNLAVYAAAKAKPEVRSRILEIFDNDGPGFTERFLKSTGYLEIRDRVQVFLPQSSIVGMLFSHAEDYTVVHSGQVGVMQHDPYSWEVLGRDFVTLERVTAGSRFVDRTIRDWISRMSVSERERLFDALYSVLGATGAETWSELSARWFQNARTVLQKCAELDPESRRMIGRTITQLLRASTGSLREFLPGRNSK